MTNFILGLFAFILVLGIIIMLPYVVDSLLILSLDYYPLCGV